MQSHFPQWKKRFNEKRSRLCHKADMILSQQAATAAQNTSQNAKNLKKYYYALLKVANYAHTLSRHRQKCIRTRFIQQGQCLAKKQK